MPPALSVVVPARDAAATIEATLEGLAAQEVPGGIEIIVVDNGSLDDTPERVEAAGVRLLRRERGAGPGAARNDGVMAAGAPNIAFTDADCIPTPGWAAAGLAALADADLVQGKVLPDPSATRQRFDRTLEVVRERGFYETANLFVRRSTFEDVGGFRDFLLEDDPAARPLGEDVLFAWTARRHGARTAFSEQALVHHAVFPGDLRTFVAEKGRLVDFPALIREIPELREHVAYRRYFLNARSAAFDAAVAGVVTAAVTRRRSPLLLAVPWCSQTARKGRRAGWPRGLVVVAIDVLGDAASCLALVRGSLRHRTPLG